jgi:hypothetical protein
MQRIKTLWKSSGKVGKIMILVGSLVAFCCSCLFIFSFMQGIGIIPTSTPTPTIDLVAMQSTAQASAYQSFTQTALAQPTLALPTSTVASMFDLIPSATTTPVIISSPTNPPPTAIQIPTNAPPIIAPPPSSTTGYDNNGDGKVTCADFQTQAAAQQAYNAGYTKLDGNDKDGKACETLP